MPSPQPDPAELNAMQDDIYRERILRARRMTMVERFEAALEVSETQMGMMLGGAMHRLNTDDEEAGWTEVRRWMQRLDAARLASRR